MNNIPDGWQLVPKEQTQEMRAAAVSAATDTIPVYTEDHDCHPNDVGRLCMQLANPDQMLDAAWPAMLAAAPQPPVALVDELVEIARLRKAITDYLDGNYDHPRKHRMDTETKGTCAHGVYYWEECGQCIDAHFEAALTPTAEQASVRNQESSK